MAKVGFVSLGCPKNLVDSEVMLGMLSRGGHQVTAAAEEAEVLVVNTCGFIQSAQQESIDTILEMARHKESGSCRRLVVAGCLVERYRDQIRSQIPEVDAVVGVNEIPSILEACRLEEEADRIPRYERRELFLYDENDPRLRTTPSYSAYLKIAEGCDHPCTFCVIPQMRGRFRSRPSDSILAEARQLARQGVRELNLVGQDTTMYGWDLGNRRGLADLIRSLGEVEGLRWIRFLYAYPNHINDDLLSAIRETGAACKYIDVPLQHASKSVLSRMRRGSHRQALMRLVERIREQVPGVAVRTTMIVGFPGESEKDFEDLMGFVEEARFDRLGVFTYSDERQAASASLEGKVPKALARSRQKRIMRLQRRISKQANRRLLGRVLPVLVEGPSKESDLFWEGRLSTQAPDIDGVVYLTDGVDETVRPGDIVEARIVEAHEYDLVAHLLPGRETTDFADSTRIQSVLRDDTSDLSDPQDRRGSMEICE